LNVQGVRPVLQRLFGEAKDGLVSRPRRDAPPLAPVIGVREARPGLTLAVQEQLREAPGPALVREELRYPALALARLPAGDRAAAAHHRFLAGVSRVDDGVLLRPGVLRAEPEGLAEDVRAAPDQDRRAGPQAAPGLQSPERVPRRGERGERLLCR